MMIKKKNKLRLQLEHLASPYEIVLSVAHLRTW